MWQKYSHMWFWYCTMWGWYHQMGKKKNKGTTEYDKSIVACDVGTTQCKDDTIKYEKKKRNH